MQAVNSFTPISHALSQPASLDQPNRPITSKLAPAENAERTGANNKPSLLLVGTCDCV